MLRFSLMTFLVAIAVGSLVVAGLASPNLIWVQIVGTTTLVALLVASVTGIAWHQSSGWFWIGFAMAGWSYLVFCSHPGADSRGKVVTNLAVSQLDELLGTSNPIRTPAGYRVSRIGDRVWLGSPGRSEALSLDEAEKQGYLKYAYTPNTKPEQQHFYDIGHYGWTLVLGCIGGWLSLALHRKSMEANHA